MEIGLGRSLVLVLGLWGGGYSYRLGGLAIPSAKADAETASGHPSNLEAPISFPGGNPTRHRRRDPGR